MRPIHALRLLLKQVYSWPGVNIIQQQRVLTVGLKHARSTRSNRSNNNTDGGTIWVAGRFVPYICQKIYN